MVRTMKTIFRIALVVAVSSCTSGKKEGEKQAPADRAAPEATAATEAPAASPAAEEPPAAPTEAPPEIGPNAALRPTFVTSDGTHGAGTAFVVKWSDGRHLLLTAHHLFGPAGGMNRDVDAAELPRIFKSVDARSVDDREVSVKSGVLLSLPEAGPIGKAPINRDLAAFLVDDPGKAAILPLAPELPAKGARIYLVAELVDRPGRIWPARVENATSTIVAYSFDDSGLNLQATSGAPVVDGQGRVVATNRSGGSQGGKLVGFGNPVVAIREMLDQALPAAK
jgi:hypothetical protein